MSREIHVRCASTELRREWDEEQRARDAFERLRRPACACCFEDDCPYPDGNACWNAQTDLDRAHTVIRMFASHV